MDKWFCRWCGEQLTHFESSPGVWGWSCLYTVCKGNRWPIGSTKKENVDEKETKKYEPYPAPNLKF